MFARCFIIYFACGGAAFGATGARDAVKPSPSKRAQADSSQRDSVLASLQAWNQARVERLNAELRLAAEYSEATRELLARGYASNQDARRADEQREWLVGMRVRAKALSGWLSSVQRVEAETESTASSPVVVWSFRDDSLRPQAAFAISRTEEVGTVGPSRTGLDRKARGIRDGYASTIDKMIGYEELAQAEQRFWEDYVERLGSIHVVSAAPVLARELALKKMHLKIARSRARFAAAERRLMLVLHRDEATYDVRFLPNHRPSDRVQAEVSCTAAEVAGIAFEFWHGSPIRNVDGERAAPELPGQQRLSVVDAKKQLAATRELRELGFASWLQVRQAKLAVEQAQIHQHLSAQKHTLRQLLAQAESLRGDG